VSHFTVKYSERKAERGLPVNVPRDKALDCYFVAESPSRRRCSDTMWPFTRSSQGLAKPPIGICNLSANKLPTLKGCELFIKNHVLEMLKCSRFRSNTPHRGQPQSTENGSGFAPGKNRPGLCCLSQFPRDKSHLPKQATVSDTEIQVLDSVAWLHRSAS
jgi:hypothetical protein